MAFLPIRRTRGGRIDTRPKLLPRRAGFFAPRRAARSAGVGDNGRRQTRPTMAACLMSFSLVRVGDTCDLEVRLPVRFARRQRWQSEAELGIVWRVIVERSVNGLDALFLQAFEMVLHFLQSLG
jgi:hypothetical protein